MDQLKAWPVVDVLARAGVDVVRVGSDVSFQCPACGKEKRHTKGSDKRWAAKVVRGGSGWWCEPCGETGSTVDLAAFVVKQRAKGLRPEEWAEVRRWCASYGLCDADPRDGAAAPRIAYTPPLPIAVEPPKPFPLKAEVGALWLACSRLDAVESWDSDGEWCGGPRRYLTKRGLNVSALANLDAVRILPPATRYERPEWAAWGDDYRIVLPMVDAGGQVATFRFRRVGDAGDGPKEGAARGRAGGCFFASPAAVAMLRGGVPLPELVVVEGSMDFLSALSMRPGAAVVGVVSGSAAGLVAVPEPARARVGTQGDGTGEKYAAEVRKVWPRAEMVRVSMGTT